MRFFCRGFAPNPTGEVTELPYFIAGFDEDLGGEGKRGREGKGRRERRGREKEREERKGPLNTNF